MEHTSAFTSIIDSQLLPMRVGIVFLMGCCILAAYCTNKRKNIEKKEYPMLLKGYPEHCKGLLASTNDNHKIFTLYIISTI